MVETQSALHAEGSVFDSEERPSKKVGVPTSRKLESL